MDNMSKSDVTDQVRASSAGHLAYEEVLHALDSLSEEDKLRLRLIERRRLVDTDFAEGDLVQEAVCGAIFGTRKCPRDESFIAFLAETMQSIASHRRARLKRQVPVADGAGNEDGAIQLEDGRLDPEEALISGEDDQHAAEVLANLQAQLSGDDEAGLLLLGWDEELRGKSLREAVGVDQARLDYIIKRVRRVAAKHYPKGWRL